MRGCPIDGDNAGGDDGFEIHLGSEWVIDIYDDGGGTSGDDLTVGFLCTDIAWLQSARAGNKRRGPVATRNVTTTVEEDDQG